MFKVIDYHNETVKEGFKTSRDAWCWLSWRFSEGFINMMGFKVIREEVEDERGSSEL